MRRMFRDSLVIISLVGGKALSLFRYFGIGVYAILTSKILIVVLVICFGLGILQNSLGFREILIQKEQEMMIDKDLSNVDYYYDIVDVIDYGDNMAISDMIDCYQNNMKLDDVSSNILKDIENLEKLYDSDNRYFSFLYQDLFSGFTVSYNADSAIFTASAIKAPAMIYIYNMASQNKIDLNEKLVYTSKYYNSGTGVLKNSEINTVYTVEDLIQYTINDSDNIAYNMLMERFGRENIYNFWSNLGTKNIFKFNTIWGYMSANDALIYMKELYRFSKENEEYGSKLLEHFKSAKWKLISNKDGIYNTANKGGWSEKSIHDVAIVFDENPYILVVMSNLGESSYSYLFSEMSKRVGKLHEDYWKYKVELCSNIKLY